jgi:glycosyltransferase involved in cell wall biosynthesis/lipopolysaccharide biosynthesis regulator YciM
MARSRFWRRRSRPSKGTPESRKVQNLARDHYNSKDYDLAEPLLRELIKVDPKNEWAMDVLSRLLMNTRRHAEATPIIQKLSTPGPDYAIFQHRLARCLYNSDRKIECISILTELIHRTKINDEGWEMLYGAMQREYEKVEIDEFWKGLSALKLSYTQVDLEMIRIDLQSSELASAAQRIQTVTQVMGNIRLSNKWKLKLVNILIDENAPEIAYEIINTISKSTPDYTKTLIKIKRSLGDNEGAMQTAIEALEDSVNHGVIFAIIRLSWDLGSMEEVVIYADKILADKPTQRVAHRFRLQALVKIGNVERILSAIKNSLAAIPDFIEAHRVMIDIGYSEFEDWDLVIKHCDAILEFDPSDRRSLCHRIQSLIKLDRYDEMENLIESATKIHPDNDEIDLTASQAYWKMKNGRHVERINRMLSRHELEPVYISGKNQSVSIENLRCSPPKSEDKEQPLVSIIMTVYGRDEYLDVAIDSILSQTHHNLELITVDDCSIDDAYEYLQQKAINEPRLKVMQVAKNGGTYCAKNSAIAVAKGEYLAFMDSDDWTHPQRIERQVNAIHNTDYRAVCHSYFRINEHGDIFYKGVGAIRLACISLLAHRSVFEEIGYFDSMRVGADTEFIERIKAVFGNESLLHDRIPSMFMLNHTSSLTGGGPFQISWRSITGARLEHHSSFKSWHKQIRHSGISPYVAHPLKVRPYEIPEEMISGDSHWKEGMMLFSERIISRNNRWWGADKVAPWQSKLSEKLAGSEWAKRLDVSTPELIWVGNDLNKIPKLATLPKQIVIKPSKGFSSNNVLCLKNGTNLLDGREWNDELIQEQYGSDKFLSKAKPKWIVEELLKPEDWSEDEIIPRDWKFYCFGGKVALIHVVLRSFNEEIFQTSHHYFTPDLRQLKTQVKESHSIHKDPLYFPECWDEMIKQVRLLGRELNCFMRIDMYATNKGPVFGEFTPTPDGGIGYTEFADKYLATFWKGLEGVEE